MNPEAEILIRDCEDLYGLGDFTAILERCEPLLTSDDPDLKIAAHLSMGSGLFGVGRFTDGQTHLQAAFDLRERGSPEMAVEAMCAYAAEWRGSYSNLEEASTLYQEARSIALSAKYKRGYAIATIGAGAVLGLKKSGADVTNLLDMGLEDARRERAKNAELNAWNEFGLHYQTHRQYDKAVKCFKQMITRAQLFNDRTMEVMGLANLGYSLIFSGGFRAYEEAMRYCEEAVRLAQSLKYPYGEMAALRVWGMALMLGDPLKAIPPFEHALKIARETHYNVLITQLLGVLSNIAVRSKDYTRVQQYLDEVSIQYADALDGTRSDYAAVLTLQSVARMYSALGEYHQSAVYWRRSMHMMSQLGIGSPIGRGLNYVVLIFYDLADALNTLTGAKARRKRKRMPTPATSTPTSPASTTTQNSE